MHTLPIWNERLTCRLRPHSGQSILKIVLKTKNEAFFIEQWIEHHAAIVGYGNILILDNASDDPDVLAIYERYAAQVEIIRFDGFHNDIHDVDKFPRLYAAVTAGSLYYIFMDTDEFLYFYEDGKFHSNEIVRLQLTHRRSIQSVPTTWMYTATGHYRRAACGVSAGTLEHGLLWGKPIVRSAANLTGFTNHNCQIPAKELTRYGATAGFFVLHLAQVSPRQRIRANMAKLVARGFATPVDTPEAIVARSAAGWHSNVPMYQAEIERHLQMPETFPAESTPLEPGLLQIANDGVATFASGLEESVFRRFVDNFAAICEQTLRTGMAHAA